MTRLAEQLTRAIFAASVVLGVEWLIVAAGPAGAQLFSPERGATYVLGSAAIIVTLSVAVWALGALITGLLIPSAFADESGLDSIPSAPGVMGLPGLPGLPGSPAASGDAYWSAADAGRRSRDAVQAAVVGVFSVSLLCASAVWLRDADAGLRAWASLACVGLMCAAVSIWPRSRLMWGSSLGALIAVGLMLGLLIVPRMFGEHATAAQVQRYAPVTGGILLLVADCRQTR